jgi:hypothetical protein
MLLLFVPVAAVALGFVLGLLRPAVALAAGVVVFVLVAAYVASGPRGSQDGEPITGAAGVLVVLLWVLVPWLAGIGVAALVRRR